MWFFSFHLWIIGKGIIATCLQLIQWHWSRPSHEATVERDVIAVLYCSPWRTGSELKCLRIWHTLLHICEPNSIFAEFCGLWSSVLKGNECFLLIFSKFLIISLWLFIFNEFISHIFLSLLCTDFSAFSFIWMQSYLVNPGRNKVLSWYSEILPGCFYSESGAERQSIIWGKTSGGMKGCLYFSILL